LHNAQLVFSKIGFQLREAYKIYQYHQLRASITYPGQPPLQRPEQNIIPILTQEFNLQHEQQHWNHLLTHCHIKNKPKVNRK
jgi:hypothetical protein